MQSSHWEPRETEERVWPCEADRLRATILPEACKKQTKQKQTNKGKTNPPNIFVAGSLSSQELGLKLSLSEAAAVLRVACGDECGVACGGCKPLLFYE